MQGVGGRHKDEERAKNYRSKLSRRAVIKTRIGFKDRDTVKDRVEVKAEEEEMVKVEEDLEEEDMTDKEGVGAIKETLSQGMIIKLNPVKGAAMTRKGGVAGPSRPASGKERRLGSRRLLQEQGLSIGRRGDKLERKARQEIDEDDVPLKQVLDRKRTTIQKGNDSASKTTRVQEKRRNREKKQSEEEEEGEREQDMMRGEEGKKEVEEVAKEKEGTEEKKEKEEEGEKGPDMVSGEEGKKEVEEIAKEKEDTKEKEKEEEEGNQAERETGVAAAENPLRGPGSKRMTKEEREKREEENKEWRNRMVASMKEGELPADAPWSEKIERILLIESIRGSNLVSDMDKLIKLHELLRDECLLEGGAKVAKKLEGA
ncbi:hypothetical protein CBR_g57096 [Chara braunii]|uniref:Uncharacterized protein n=1 Tax=Chara braunii TaxID=69332 RepID=A0A388K850_CHABU|nr:hypothetical protein CBR_g57096 [Chara braunii]|eukprot:GBG66217.1 hypothetical protein CBR_g57096 [Chara braunii]